MIPLPLIVYEQVPAFWCPLYVPVHGVPNWHRKGR